MARRKPSAASRGYDHAHRRERARWAKLLESAGMLPCADPKPGCRAMVFHGSKWDLAHVHGDRSRYLGPSHPECNRYWAAQVGNRSPKRRLRGRAPAPAGVFGPLSS